MSPKNKKLTLLHLSDLHVRQVEEEKTDRKVVLKPLVDRLKTDYKRGLRPELVLVSGDIAFQGIRAEYDLALPYLKNILDALHLEADRLYMVPGNHDVNRKIYRPTEIPSYNTNREINKELANPDYRADLMKGMKDYFEFIQTNFSHLKSKHEDLVPFVNRFTSKMKLNIGLVGLNSAWMCRKRKEDEEDSGRIAIGQHQILSAFEELGEKSDFDAVVALFHHPLSWLALMDRRVCQQTLNRTIALAGHLHEPGGGYQHGLSTQMVHIQAGGAYLGSDSDWPSRYQYLEIDLDNSRLRLDFRAFSESENKWHADGATGDDGKVDIPVGFLGRRETTPDSSAPVLKLPEFPEAYARWLNDNFKHLEARGLSPKGKALHLSLPELFVPLYGADPAPKMQDPEKGDHLGPSIGAHRDEESKGVEIERLVADRRTLLITGQAGCGKSTLLKHLAYTISPLSDNEPISPALIEYLPVLIQLKDLEEYCRQDITKLDRPASKGKCILDWYLKNRVAEKLDIGTVQGFAKCGRLLLLVDGLDEIDDQSLRDHVVNALADEVLDPPENKIVLAGRPHGLEGAPTTRFADSQTSIEDLEQPQIKQFVRQWFDYFYPDTTGIGKKTADDLLGDIQDHPALDKLIVNPLMLTAICLLYYDEKELPNQRAELIKKFIDNMIWRRFEDPETVLNHLNSLAHEMHFKRVRVMYRHEAIQAMAKPLVVLSDEKPISQVDKEKLFDHIEPRCGLLIEQKGRTGFWHLIFQEFLTAQQLMNTHEDKRAAIASLWSDEWFKEVIELYVSYLSIYDPSVANGIIKNVIDKDDESPFRSWRLAARTLVDFHPSRQSPKVVAKVRERLKHVISKPLEAATLVDAGETLGWLGDDRDLGVCQMP